MDAEIQCYACAPRYLDRIRAESEPVLLQVLSRVRHPMEFGSTCHTSYNDVNPSVCYVVEKYEERQGKVERALQLLPKWTPDEADVYRKAHREKMEECSLDVRRTIEESANQLCSSYMNAADAQEEYAGLPGILPKEKATHIVRICYEADERIQSKEVKLNEALSRLFE